MSSDLELYHKILFFDRPWMDLTTTDGKYQQLFHTVSKETFANQPLYELSLLKPLTPKRKYYQAIIVNEAIRFLNCIDNLIKDAINENEKKYHIHSILSKKLPAILVETEKIISSRGLYFSLVDDISKDKRIRDNAFIIQYLKYQLIRLYLEIQNGYAAYWNDETFTAEDIHSMYFSEPFQPIIKTAAGVGLPNVALEITPVPVEIKFTPVKGDFRPGKQGIVSYNQIISNHILFASFEEKLFEMELIDKNYNFSNEHTEKQKLAAIYCVLIQKGYFIKKDFIKKQKIKDVDIRKFLDYRYNTNRQAQFRSWLRNPDKLAQYLIPLSWPYQLPLS